MSEFALQSGVVLAGKYRVERILGQGGMGVVAAVYHLQLEQRMALKLMLPHAMASGDAISRFMREARAAARITSEHVARVFDVGALDTGEPYIAMEYLEGQDIAQVLAARGRIPPEEAVEYLLQACEALAEAHVAGIIHRDLKPGNLFLVHRVDGQRLVKVLDFGISKMTGAPFQSNAPATHTSALMGSPLYMSPEQMGSAKAVDARSDVWALGVVLYEMLSGTPPFNGETLPQVCGMVMSEEPPPLNARAQGIPELLGAVVGRCLKKDPNERFQSVAELAQALVALASPRARQSVDRISRVQGMTAHAPVVSTLVATAVTAPSMPRATSTRSEPAPPQAGTYAPWGETKPPVATKRSTRPVVLGLAALLALGSGVAFLFERSRGGGPTAEPSAQATAAAVAPSAEPEVSDAVAPAIAASPSSAASAGRSAGSLAPAPLAPAASPVQPAVGRRPAVSAAKAEAPTPPVAKSATPPAPSPTPAASVPASTRSRL